VRCTYDSIRGPVTCDWKRDGDQVVLDLRVPVGSSAVLYLPAASTQAVTENGRPAADSEGVEKLSEQAGQVIFRLGSGRYRFVIFMAAIPVQKWP
jgi:alpha-L-rhamnosidase